MKNLKDCLTKLEGVNAVVASTIEPQSLPYSDELEQLRMKVKLCPNCEDVFEKRVLSTCMYSF